MENKNQPKHTLSIVGFILGIISIFAAIILLSGGKYQDEASAGILFVLSLYSAVPAVICSAIAKGKNTEIYPIIGLISGIISMLILILFIASIS